MSVSSSAPFSDVQLFGKEPAPRLVDVQALRDVTLRSITIGRADCTFVLENVEGLVLDNVVIGGQRIDGRLDLRQAGLRRRPNRHSMGARLGKYEYIPAHRRPLGVPCPRERSPYPPTLEHQWP